MEAIVSFHPAIICQVYYLVPSHKLHLHSFAQLTWRIQHAPLGGRGFASDPAGEAHSECCASP